MLGTKHQTHQNIIKINIDKSKEVFLRIFASFIK